MGGDHSIRLLWVGGTAQHIEHSRYPIMEFSGGRWRNHKPSGDLNHWYRKIARALSYLLGDGPRASENDGQRRSVEHRADDMVGIGFLRADIVLDAETRLFLAHPHNPLFVTSDGIVRPLPTGVQS